MAFVFKAVVVTNINTVQETVHTRKVRVERELPLHVGVVDVLQFPHRLRSALLHQILEPRHRHVVLDQRHAQARFGDVMQPRLEGEPVREAGGEAPRAHGGVEEHRMRRGNVQAARAVAVSQAGALQREAAHVWPPTILTMHEFQIFVEVRGHCQVVLQYHSNLFGVFFWLPCLNNNIKLKCALISLSIDLQKLYTMQKKRFEVSRKYSIGTVTYNTLYC